VCSTADFIMPRFNSKCATGASKRKKKQDWERLKQSQFAGLMDKFVQTSNASLKEGTEKESEAELPSEENAESELVLTAESSNVLCEENTNAELLSKVLQQPNEEYEPVSANLINAGIQQSDESLPYKEQEIMQQSSVKESLITIDEEELCNDNEEPPQGERPCALLSAQTEQEEQIEECYLEASLPLSKKNEHSTVQHLNDMTAETNLLKLLPELKDIGEWPKTLNTENIRLLLQAGPTEVVSTFEFPSNSSGRRFSYNFFFQKNEKWRKVP